MSRPLTPLALAVLHMLAEKPMHPYEMRQRIRDHGIDEALAQLRTMISRPVQEYPVLGSALTFARMLPPDELAPLLRRRAVAVEARIAAHDTIIDGLRKQGGGRIGLIEVEYCQAVLRAELDWLRAAEDDITSGRLRWQ